MMTSAARNKATHAVADDDQLADRDGPFGDQALHDVGKFAAIHRNAPAAVVMQIERRIAEITRKGCAVIVTLARPLQIVHAQAVQQHQQRPSAMRGVACQNCAIQNQRPLWSRGQVQNCLGAFGFSGDEVTREIGSLSGGERARMALALMQLARANLLILDEPTNHLDVENIEALEDALEEFEGSVLLVSHDRAFLREVATRVWSFDGTRLRDFDGPFVEWEQNREDRPRRAARS